MAGNILATAAFTGLCLFVHPALAQPDHPLVNEHQWISKKKNPTTGYGCCGKNDVHRLDPAYAGSLKVGDRIIVDTQYGRWQVEIDVIYPSHDPNGYAWITKFGCLFTASGV